MLAAGLAATVAGCGAVQRTDTGALVPSPILHPPPATRLFSADGIWNQAVPPGAPLDPRSGELVAGLAAEAAREQSAGIGPWIATSLSSVPLYEVRADQPVVQVQVDNLAPYKLSLARAFRSVPLPAGAEPAPGSDSQLALWQPATDRMWEFFEMHREPDGWHANWGGAMAHVSSNPGWFSTAAWPGAQDDWGATGTGLALAGGLITVRELERGRIDHALALALPTARAGCRALPAPRTDGADPSPGVLPEGAHLRLDPNVNVGALGLPRAAEIIALAAQRYGIVVRDKTAHAIGFYAEDPHRLGRDPYPSLFDGLSPGELLRDLPWGRLQVLRAPLRCSTG